MGDWRRKVKEMIPTFVSGVRNPVSGSMEWQPDDLHLEHEDTYPEIPTAISFLTERTDVVFIGGLLDDSRSTSGSR